MNELIKLVQLPVIEEHLRQLQADIQSRVDEVKSLACTPDTLVAVKKARAELSRVFQALEEKRKAVKKAIMEPYEKFEAVYAECISGPMKEADADLKAKIAETEGAIKDKCLEQLMEYFSELCALNGVEWLPFIRSGVVVDLTSTKQKTPRKLMAQLKEFVERVASDVECISSMDNAEEIMAEYKVCLNVSTAISTVNTRHQRIEQERKAAEERRTAQEAQRAAVERVQAVAPPVITPAPQTKPQASETLTATFTVTGTRSQLIALREYMQKEGLKYE